MSGLSSAPGQQRAGRSPRDRIADRRAVRPHWPRAQGCRLRHLREQLRQRARGCRDPGRAHPHRGPRLRWDRHGAEGRADRDLASQRRRQVRAPGRPPAGQVDRSALSRLGPQLHDFDSGVYSFDTIKPGPVEGRKGRIMAPHISAWVVARGINIGLNTRIYFSDEAAANAKDPVINLIEWEARRRTLVAERTDRRADNGAVVYRFDIRLQGDDETGLLRRLKTALRQDPTARAERRRPRRSRAANRSGPTRRHGRPPG
jgi:hypothetical protein